MATWQDKERISWGISDQNLSKIAAEQVKKDILEVGNRPVILVTHVVTHPDFIVPMPHRIFDFYNAFIGTSDFNPLYAMFDIPYSIMGHVHFESLNLLQMLSLSVSRLSKTMAFRRYLPGIK